jgi:O-antigen ligase
MNLTLLPALAVLLPTLLAYNQTPAATLYNQLLALSAWGLVLLLMPAGSQALRRSARLPLAALVLLGAAVLLAAWQTRSPQELGALALLGGAAAVFVLGARAQGAQRQALAEGLAWGCLLTGLAGALIGAVQVFLPALADGQWIARSGFAGRAVGNVRQPNHLATLLLMGSVGLIWLAQRRAWRALPVALGLQLLVGAVVLSASRTGLWFGVPLLLLWGLLDTRLERRWRGLLLATPLMAALAWGGLHAWASWSGQVFGAEARLDQEGAGSPSRLAILRDAWALLLAEPWGVGFGGFNRAWTLSAFPQRPIAFFDHTHNLPLQLLVELGWPLGGAVLGLLLAGFAAAARLAWRAGSSAGAGAVDQRAALMLLLVVGVHSMLEYPLWYAYFLLPTALAFGLALPGQRSARAPLRWPAGLGALLIAASAFALWEYQRVVAIYAPARDGAPLAQRIARGQSTLFFSRHADYAGATALGADAAALAAAQRTGWQLIDARLLIAWARSLHAVGETDKARWLVARLREFRSRDGDAWLEACGKTPDDWMCAPPARAYSWREF